jgi:hypothetical protein
MRTGTARVVVPFNLLMDPSLKARMQAIAYSDGRSMGKLVESIIDSYVSNREQENGKGCQQQNTAHG